MSRVTSCVVAGTLLSATGAEKMLLSRWNGRAFTAMKAAAPAGAGSIVMLNDVSCPAVNHCVAAGISLNNAGTSGFGFTEMWNGTSWTARKVARPKGETESFALGVSCVTPANCVAVGAGGTSAGGHAEALSYNGTTWSQWTVPRPGKGKSSVLEGVSCPRANDCVAIGVIGATNGNTLTPLAGLWNGTTWKLRAA